MTVGAKTAGLGVCSSSARPVPITFDDWGYRRASQDRFVLRHLSLTIPAGQHVLLLGASGIGKSTLLGAMAGLVGSSAPTVPAQPAGPAERSSADGGAAGRDGHADSSVAGHPADAVGTAVTGDTVTDEDGGTSEGRLLVDGVPASSPAARGKTALVLQDPFSQAVLQRVGDNVAFGLENLGVPRQQIWPRVRQAMQLVGLGDLELNRQTAHLSGGQMQRLALAGALCMRPGALLLDEPTANLDPPGARSVSQAVRKVLAGHPSTLVLVEHRAADWLDLIDRVILLGTKSTAGRNLSDNSESEDGTPATSGAGGSMHGAICSTHGTVHSVDSADPDDESADAVVVADGTPDEVFSSDLDFDALGIWVPEKYAAGRRQKAEIAGFRHHEPQDRASVDGTASPPSSASSEPSGSAAFSGLSRSTESPGQSESQKTFEASGPSLIHTEDLSIGRDGRAIASDIDLSFRPGEVTALVGPNGVGKTTFALTLSGLLPSVAGKVVAGEDLREGLASADPHDWPSKALATRVSYVFQAPEHQFVRSTVLAEAMTGPLAAGKSPDEAREIAERTLGTVGLLECADRNPYTLSGGQKRRLTVASALAAAARVLVLDEPTFGQDRLTWGRMARLIRLAADRGVAVVMVTHDTELVEAVADRVVRFRMATEEAEKDDHQPLMVGDRLSALSFIKGDAGDAGAGGRGTRSAHLWQGSRLLADQIGREGVPPTDRQVLAVPAADRHEPKREASPSRFVATLNPAARLLAAVGVSVPIVLTLDVVSASVFFVLIALALLCLGFTPRIIVRRTWPVWVAAPWSFLAVLLYGKPGGRVFLDWGWIHVTQRSLLLATATLLRVLTSAVPAVLLMLGVDTTDLADALSQVLRLPDRFVYGGLAGTRMVSVLRDDWTALGQARRSRGLGEQSRLARFFPQAFALLVLSIRRSTQLATAMQARGFGGTAPRTHARLSRWRRRDGWFVAVSLLIPTCAVLASVFVGSFAFLGGR